jgi:tetratricopeptide (TPR) repeat protein
MAIAAMMAMIATTIINSIRVKPARLILLIWKFLLVRSTSIQAIHPSERPSDALASGLEPNSGFSSVPAQIVRGLIRRALVRLLTTPMGCILFSAAQSTFRGAARNAQAILLATLGLAATGVGALAAQDSAPPARSLRYVPAAAASCGVQRGIVYLSGSDAEQSLCFDLYTPPEFHGDRRLPVVVFINGVGFRDLKDWGQYTSWARAVACEGLAAVTYQALPDRAADELDSLMLYLKEHQVELSIDASNMGWWACSDNVLQALPQAMSKARPYLHCAVFYYGMPEQWPAIRPDLSLCIVKAGVDNAELNSRIDRFALQAAALNVDMTYIVHASARHAFDVSEDGVRTRDIIQDTLKFMRIQLSEKQQQEAETAALERSARLAYFRENWTEMEKAYDGLTKLKPDSGEAHFRLGFARLFLGKFETAAPEFERAADLDFMRPAATYNVACCKSRLGDIDGALGALRQAFERGFDNKKLLETDPDLANLRGDPRYAVLKKEWLEKHTGGDQKP